MSTATAAVPQTLATPATVPTPQTRPTPPDHPSWHMPLAIYEKIIETGLLEELHGVYLWQGSLCKQMASDRPHIGSVKKVFLALHSLRPEGYTAEQEAPMALRFADSAPQPDIKVLRGRDQDYEVRMPTSADAPLVIEVTDSTLAKDRGMATTYAVEQIPIYWLMNIPASQIEVYSLPINGVYTSVQLLGPTDQVPVVLDGHEVGRLRVADLLP